MSRLHVHCSLALCVLGSVLLIAPAQAPRGKKYALIVGINEYTGSNLTKLRFAENDADELAALLNKPEAGFATMRLLTSARGKKDAPTTQNIRDALTELLREKGRHDTVLIAFSGHGVQLEVEDPDGEKPSKTYPYFCPTDADFIGVSYSTGFAKKLINLNDLVKQLGRSNAGKKLVLVDACRNELKADSATRSIDLGAVAIPKGVGILYSCKAGEKAFEHASLGKKGHGVFFYQVLKGLSGEARNKRNEVTWDSLRDYVKDQVIEQVPLLIKKGAQQTPHDRCDLEGIITLVRVRDKVINSIGMELVKIPAGEFLMGSAETEKGRDRFEPPRRRVKVEKAFFLGTTEVTQAQYKKVIGSNPSHFPADEKEASNFPVENVSWQEAEAFCKKLTVLDAESKANRVYRLPTEAEWEFACRAGTTTVFHLGNDLGSGQEAFDASNPYGAGKRGEALKRPARVGTHSVNAWGLYDMHGNVKEWCSDSAKGFARVIRGGAWSESGLYCRSAARHYLKPTEKNNQIGFRVVMQTKP